VNLKRVWLVLLNHFSQDAATTGRIERPELPMKKKKLLITVGAGAAIDFGMPSVSDVDKILDQRAGQLCPLSADPTSNLYRHCRDAINAYYAETPKPALQKWANFEEVLYQINLLVSLVSDPWRLHGSNALLRASSLPEVLELGNVKATDENVLRRLANALTDELVDYFIDACAAASLSKAAEIAELGKFLSIMEDEFEIGVVTLNYDNLISQALPGLHSGFNASGHFDPISVLTRTEWKFIYHLHGSVHFRMAGTPHDLHGITWTASPLKDHAVHADGRNSQNSIEGTPYPMSPIVAGYGKTQQILRQPFRTYFAQLNRLSQEADSLLFLGYGFSDLHLNAVFSEVRNRPRPIVIVDWASDKQDALASRQDNWSYHLFQTLPTRAGTMSRPGHVASASVAELKNDHEFEVSNSPDYPLAVWYNGMLEACRHPEKILKHLREART
jgi:hypothetical protein